MRTKGIFFFDNPKNRRGLHGVIPMKKVTKCSKGPITNDVQGDGSERKKMKSDSDKNEQSK